MIKPELRKEDIVAKTDFTKEDPWRIFRIMSEFVEGFDELSDIKRAVAVFGSSRVKPDNPYYKLAERSAEVFAEAGFAIITGAGPGIMEAANRGAYQKGVESIGLNIWLPNQQKPNKYLTRDLEFRYYFCRRVMFAKSSQAYLIFPGGFGTLDERLEVLALTQTFRMTTRPVILFNREYWQPLIKWFKQTLLQQDMICAQDLKIFNVVETPQEALRIVKKHGK